MMLCSWRSSGVILLSAVALAVAQVEEQNEPKKSLPEKMKGFIEEMMQPYMKSIVRFVIEADVSADCQVHLAKLGQALRNFEPWTNRLIDASAKIPTGLYQGTLSEIGAFDECIETVLRDEETGEETLRAQYCNIYMKSTGELLSHLRNNSALSHPKTPKFLDFQQSVDIPGELLGVCIAKDCSREDLQKLANKAAALFEANFTVKNCVDGLPLPFDNRQIFALTLLCIVVVLTIIGTAFDFARSSLCGYSGTSESHKKSIKEGKGIMSQFMLCFSAKENTSLLLKVNDDPTSEAYSYRFFHGMRFLSMYGVILGHSFAIFNFNSTARLVNALHYGESYWFCIIMSAYLCVDTFLFIGGFLLTYNILREPMGNHTLISIIALVRRFIRGTLPALFVMVLLFLVPVVFNGPRVLEWYEEYKGQFDADWWAVVLQIRNYKSGQYGHGIPCMGTLWYLSVDYQLFVVVTITLALTRRRAKPFHWMMTCYSVACALFIAIYIYDTVYTPFVVPMAEKWEIIKLTLFYFYIFAPVHAVVFFMGASTVYLIRDYKERKIRSTVSVSCWIATLVCVLIAVFGTHPWNSNNYPSEPVKVLFAVFQRPLWGLFLMWFTFCCATGRAAIVTRVLSSPSFVPLGRLSFGAFLFHVPIFFVEYITARERLYYNATNIISRSFSCMAWSFLLAYPLYLMVEAPLSRLEKLVLRRRRREVNSGNQKLSHMEHGVKKPSMGIADADSGTRHTNDGFRDFQNQSKIIQGHSVKL